MYGFLSERKALDWWHRISYELVHFRSSLDEGYLSQWLLVWLVASRDFLFALQSELWHQTDTDSDLCSHRWHFQIPYRWTLFVAVQHSNRHARINCCGRWDLFLNRLSSILPYDNFGEWWAVFNSLIAVARYSRRTDDSTLLFSKSWIKLWELCLELMRVLTYRRTSVSVWSCYTVIQWRVSLILSWALAILESTVPGFGSSKLETIFRRSFLLRDLNIYYWFFWLTEMCLGSWRCT